MAKPNDTPRVTWNLWLLNRNSQPLLYFQNLSEGEAHRYLHVCAEKVFDGSDADAFVLVRSDFFPPTTDLRIDRNQGGWCG